MGEVRKAINPRRRVRKGKKGKRAIKGEGPRGQKEPQRGRTRRERTSRQRDGQPGRLHQELSPSSNRKEAERRSRRASTRKGVHGLVRTLFRLAEGRVKASRRKTEMRVRRRRLSRRAKMTSWRTRQRRRKRSTARKTEVAHGGIRVKEGLKDGIIKIGKAIKAQRESPLVANVLPGAKVGRIGPHCVAVAT